MEKCRENEQVEMQEVANFIDGLEKMKEPKCQLDGIKIK